MNNNIVPMDIDPNIFTSSFENISYFLKQNFSLKPIQIQNIYKIINNSVKDNSYKIKYTELKNIISDKQINLLTTYYYMPLSK